MFLFEYPLRLHAIHNTVSFQPHSVHLLQNYSLYIQSIHTSKQSAIITQLSWNLTKCLWQWPNTAATAFRRRCNHILWKYYSFRIDASNKSHWYVFAWVNGRSERRLFGVAANSRARQLAASRALEICFQICVLTFWLTHSCCLPSNLKRHIMVCSVFNGEISCRCVINKKKIHFISTTDIKWKTLV